MAVQIIFTGEDGRAKIDDQDEKRYRYGIAPNGALYVLAGPTGVTTARDLRILHVYGPTAWWKVWGDMVGTSALNELIG